MSFRSYCTIHSHSSRHCSATVANYGSIRSDPQGPRDEKNPAPNPLIIASGCPCQQNQRGFTDRLRTKTHILGPLLGLLALIWVPFLLFRSSDFSSIRSKNHTLPRSKHDYSSQVSPDDDEFNRCVYNTLEYDGPSEFNLADTKNLDFVVGSGNYDANIYVYTAADANEPTIEIRGAVSPYYDDNDPMTSLASRKKIIPKRGSRTGGRGEMNTVYQGLHFETNRTGDHTTFFVWYEDHILQDEWGMPYSTCALLQMDLVLPPAVDLQRLSIHGNQVKIHTRDLKGIRFDTVSLSSKRGEIHVMDLIRADTVVAKVEEKGDVTLESVEVATTGAVLEIAATAKKGDVLVNALISPADLSREMDQKDSKIVAISQTGTVQVNVHAKPSERSLVEDQSIRSSLGSLWVVAQSESGQVQTQISLLGKDQNLRLQGESKTGKVTSIISDEFSGRFNIEAPLGIAMIETATKPGSSSQIIYEKELVTTKAGTKSGQDGKEIHGGQVELRSRFGGSVFLGFV